MHRGSVGAGMRKLFHGWREILTGKQTPVERDVTRPKEQVPLCAACWSKITSNGDRLAQVEFVEAQEIPVSNADPPCQEATTADRPIAACGECRSLMTDEDLLRPNDSLHWCKAEIVIAKCQDKNTDGTCPDFEQRTPQFNYLAGGWTA